MECHSAYMKQNIEKNKWKHVNGRFNITLRSCTQSLTSEPGALKQDLSQVIDKKPGEKNKQALGAASMFADLIFERGTAFDIGAKIPFKLQ